LGGARNVSNIPLPEQGGSVRRARFQAEQIDFYAEGWQANNVRITNDPFRRQIGIADKVTLTRGPYETESDDQTAFGVRPRLSCPSTERDRNRTERDTSPGLAQIGFDGDDRGGVFFERGFTPVDTEQVRVSLTPVFAQKAVEESGGNASSIQDSTV